MKEALEKRVSDYELLHLHSIFLWPTWAAARLAEKRGVPYVVSPRGMLVKDLIKRKNTFLKTLWINVIERRTLRKAAAIHMTTQLELDEAKCLDLHMAPSFVIPNGIEVGPEEKINETECAPEVRELVIKRKPLVLYLGRIHWKKGLDRLIPAMTYAPGATLAIVGNDEENYRLVLEKLAISCGVADRVIFSRPYYGPEKRMLLSHASVFVLPSYSENFGIAVLEAMAQGCPVIVTPEVGMSDVVNETTAGLVVKGDPESLGQSLRGILADEAVRLQMGENGRMAATERFSWNRIAEQMASAYKRVMVEKSR